MECGYRVAFQIRLAMIPVLREAEESCIVPSRNKIVTLQFKKFPRTTMSIQEDRGRGRRGDAPRRKEEEPATVYRPRTLRSRRSDTPQEERDNENGHEGSAMTSYPRGNDETQERKPMRSDYHDDERRERGRDYREDHGDGYRGHGRERRGGFDSDRRRFPWGNGDHKERSHGRFDDEDRFGRGRRDDRERRGYGESRSRFSNDDRGRRGDFGRRDGGYQSGEGRGRGRYGDGRGYGRGDSDFHFEGDSSYRPRTLRFSGSPDRRGGERREGFNGRDRGFGRRRDDWGQREERYSGNRYDRPPRRQRDDGFEAPRRRGNEGFDGMEAARSAAPKVQPKMPQTMDLNAPIRLNRFIAHSGMCSRREADEMIERGDIMVNGEVVTTLGTKVVPAQVEVTCKGKKLDPERKVYILLNKPKDCFSTTDDPHAGRTVLDAVEGACTERIYPVGRLDRNSTGLILLTNDGALTEQLTHPSYEKRKVYEVAVDRNVTRDEMQRLIDGVELEEGTVSADAVEYCRADRKDVLGIEIHTGQNRVVRRMLDALGLRVESLDRVYYAGLTKKDLPRGQWRYLTPQEVANLKSGRYE